MAMDYVEMLNLTLSSGSSIPSTAFGAPRSFFSNRFVYLVLSQRAQGLSIGINLNPNKHCNFKCVYCEVNRAEIALDWAVDLPVMETELETMLERVRVDKIRDLPGFAQFPSELLELKEVALSGDGEPTLSPQFREIVGSVIGMRARGKWQFFKIVLITNTAGFQKSHVREGLALLTTKDEVWVKLEAGTQEYMDRINVPDLKLTEVMENILVVARERPVVVQSLFPLFRGIEVPEEEIEEYVDRLQELKQMGAQIASVQIYSAHRPAHRIDCGHLPLAALAKIARKVRAQTGLRAEVF